LAFVPKGTRRPSGWEGGRPPWGPARLPRPHAVRHGGHGREDREEKERWGRADPWTPLVSEIKRCGGARRASVG
jgi:hypothetical protein